MIDIKAREPVLKLPIIAFARRAATNQPRAVRARPWKRQTPRWHVGLVGGGVSVVQGYLAKLESRWPGRELR